MSKSISKSAPLEDIPLAVEQQKNVNSDQKSVSKTNSLRRMFKKSCKHKEEGEASCNSEEKESEEPRRFHLRLGSRQKHLDAVDMEDMPSGSSSSSKLTLKRSIYKYWQTLFKNPKTNSGEDLPENASGPNLKTNAPLELKGDSSSDEESDDQIVNKLADSVHALKVAADTNEVEPKSSTESAAADSNKKLKSETTTEVKLEAETKAEKPVDTVSEDSTEEDNEAV